MSVSLATSVILTWIIRTELLLLLVAAVATTSIASPSPLTTKRGSDLLRQLQLENVTLAATPRIVGGQAARPGAYPSFAVSAGPSLCGATLIHADVLLTAAHCTNVFVGGGVYIMGRHGVQLDGSDSLGWYNVTREIPHPKYNNVTVENDIMLLILDKPVRDVPLQQLYTERESSLSGSSSSSSRPLTDGATVTAIGFGHTSENGPISTTLQTVDLDLVSFDTCNDYYLGRLEEGTMLCASATQGRDSCSGDSGGPLLRDGDKVQVGIVSFGDGCAGNTTPAAVYTRVAAYTTWIAATICTWSVEPPSSCHAAEIVAAAVLPDETVAPVPRPMAFVAPNVAPILVGNTDGTLPTTARPSMIRKTLAPVSAPFLPPSAAAAVPLPTRPTSTVLSNWLSGSTNDKPVPSPIPRPKAPSTTTRPSTSTNILAWFQQRLAHRNARSRRL
jgi:secreted trypsin-like serine protease